MSILVGIIGLLVLLAPILSIKKQKLNWLYHSAVPFLLLVSGFLVFSFPWIINNTFIAKELSVSAIVYTPNHISPWVRNTPEELTSMAPTGSRSLPKDLQYDPNHEMCKKTGGAEDIDRYWGTESGISHYALLPWRSVMNMDMPGYFVTLSPFLLLLPFIVFFPPFRKNTPTRLLLYAITFHLVQWIVGANGVPWYGMGIFLGCAIFAEALIRLAPNRPTSFVVKMFFSLALLFSISLRLEQLETQREYFAYPWGIHSAQERQESLIPRFSLISEHVEQLSQKPNRPFLYRAGTFISYFIPRNLEIIPENDNQLDFFNCINQEENHELTLRRLKALGFHSMVIDTNIPSIEQDPNGTLHKKMDRLLSFVNDPKINITPIVDDPLHSIAYLILDEGNPELDMPATDQ